LAADREHTVEINLAVTPATRLVSVNTPNNRTGTVLSSDELDGVVAAAERAGAWVHSDEVYAGSELDGAHAPSAWGRYDRVLVVGSLSKAYGLSGLRVGWVVGPRQVVADLWRRHEYATISTASLSMALAERALTEPLTCSSRPASTWAPRDTSASVTPSTPPVRRRRSSASRTCCRL
jgi:aspartate/methionine/tyrosine aminotransferase